ncbi:hypothetical protein ACFFK0_11865 [Paenibacillus chartarius]|uniref:Uncharacterized protein n=1 Tax=Paenibacillus chartarius TaxID=747481 RepID=A0ABV6DKF9_9BACL
MIKTQELKAQIEELTKQNDMMLVELEQMKRLIAESGRGASGSSDRAGKKQANQQADQQGEQQADNGQSSEHNSIQMSQQQQGQHQEQGQQQQQGQGQQQQQGQQQSSGSSQPAQLANELLRIKDMVAQLEKKTANYVSSSTNGGLTEKDVVNLVLTLINGMVDWSSEYISSQSPGSGQMQ